MKLSLLFPDKNYLKHIIPVTSTATTTPNLQIDKDGLFSTEIFGPIGSEERLSRFSYIELHEYVIHPRIYRNLIKMSSLYKDIMNGSIKVKLVKGKFVLDENGETGIKYFIDNIYDIIPDESSSPERQNMITSFVNQQKKRQLLNKFLIVIPAGLRDMSTEEDGRIVIDELNDYYKRCITTANILKSGTSVLSNTSKDSYILRMHDRIEDLVNEIFLKLKGKKGFIGKNVASRKVDYGTGNVISGKSRVIEDLEDNEEDSLNGVGIGMLQYAKSIEPITKFMIKNDFSAHSIEEQTSTANVYDKNKNLINIAISNKTVDTWLSSDGLTSMINKYRGYYFREYYVTFKSSNDKKKEYFPFLVRVTGKNSIEIYKNSDIMSTEYSKLKLYLEPDEYPENEEYFRPLRYGEMLSLAIRDLVDNSYGTLVRHPTADQGSLNIVKYRVTSTEDEQVFDIVEHNNSGLELKYKVKNFPVFGSTWNESLNPSYTMLDGFAADFDGF